MRMSRAVLCAAILLFIRGYWAGAGAKSVAPAKPKPPAHKSEYHYPNLPDSLTGAHRGIKVLREAASQDAIRNWADDNGFARDLTVTGDEPEGAWIAAVDGPSGGSHEYRCYIYGLYPSRAEDPRPWKLMCVAPCKPARNVDTQALRFTFDFIPESLVVKVAPLKMVWKVDLSRETKLLRECGLYDWRGFPCRYPHFPWTIHAASGWQMTPISMASKDDIGKWAASNYAQNGSFTVPGVGDFAWAMDNPASGMEAHRIFLYGRFQDSQRNQNAWKLLYIDLFAPDRYRHKDWGHISKMGVDPGSGCLIVRDDGSREVFRADVSAGIDLMRRHDPEFAASHPAKPPALIPLSESAGREIPMLPGDLGRTHAKVLTQAATQRDILKWAQDNSLNAASPTLATTPEGEWTVVVDNPLYSGGAYEPFIYGLCPTSPRDPKPWKLLGVGMYEPADYQDGVRRFRFDTKSPSLLAESPEGKIVWKMDISTQIKIMRERNLTSK